MIGSAFFSHARMVCAMPTLSRTASPVIVLSPGWSALRRRISKGSIPSRSAASSIIVSMQLALWLMPKPRNAPPCTVFVRTV